VPRPPRAASKLYALRAQVSDVTPAQRRDLPAIRADLGRVILYDDESIVLAEGCLGNAPKIVP
jgi:hypothetical protein